MSNQKSIGICDKLNQRCDTSENHDSGNFAEGIKNIAYKILEEAKEKQEDYRRSSELLQRAIMFNHDLALNGKQKNIVNRLYCSLELQKKGYKEKQKQRDFEILLANLFYQTKYPIAISLNKNDWIQTKYDKPSYFIIEQIHELHRQKFIAMATGFYTEKYSRMTRIWATEKLLNYFPEFHFMVISKPVNLVHLRELNSSKLLDYKETWKTYRIKKILKKANEVNNSVIIRHQEFKLNCNLIAIFKGNFSLYGRLHTKGYKHYQGFNPHERNAITINGDPVVELDYTGLHPNLLYAAESIQYSGDPYQVIEKDRMARPFLKRIFLFMINADFNKAQKAANFWLLNRDDEEREGLASIGITRARPLMDKLLKVHKPIEHYLCKGKETGLRLFNKDALIALDIVNHFTKKDVPVLCIHDSFIVQQQHENELLKVMIMMYAKHTKTPDNPKGFKCGVKKNL
ncbi:hypothetical protein ES705_15383 [subsurface metagenome]